MGFWENYLTPQRESILFNGIVFGMISGLASIAGALSAAQPLGLAQLAAAFFGAFLTAAVIYYQSQKDALAAGQAPGARPKKLGI